MDETTRQRDYIGEITQIQEIIKQIECSYSGLGHFQPPAALHQVPEDRIMKVLKYYRALLKTAKDFRENHV